ncbi:hypothetical protein OG756_42360 (plasmid) [Streptomyces sp. NBC_01310]|uniref:hypothetical protein n=1 Tax=Streptomyces sp. NBC_01310 TaxID=2903820 RepID=UPI0035B65EBD|nr:hypothetical protein OG756_42360 [Streptomyces sp. NBC_01310]
MHASFLEEMTEAEARCLWTWGGYEEQGPFPGRKLALLFMFAPADRGGARVLARFFALMAPHAGFLLVKALLRIRSNRSRPIALPAPAPAGMSPQRRSARITPSRAP